MDFRAQGVADLVVREIAVAAAIVGVVVAGIVGLFFWLT